MKYQCNCFNTFRLNVYSKKIFDVKNSQILKYVIFLTKIYEVFSGFAILITIKNETFSQPHVNLSNLQIVTLPIRNYF